MSDFVIYEQTGKVVTLTLNSPATRNALSHEDEYLQIVESCERINRDDNVGAVILTGAGSCFCAGGNITGRSDGICICRRAASTLD